jgi:4-hydroxybenzoate polyprenyltransferase
MLLVREMIKDLENIKRFGKRLQNHLFYNGEDLSKKNHHRLNNFNGISVYILIDIYDVGYMDIYFILVWLS